MPLSFRCWDSGIITNNDFAYAMEPCSRDDYRVVPLSIDKGAGGCKAEGQP